MVQLEAPIFKVIGTLKALENNSRLSQIEVTQIRNIRKLLTSNENLFSPKLLSLIEQGSIPDDELQNWLYAEVGHSRDSRDLRQKRRQDSQDSDMGGSKGACLSTATNDS